MVTVTGKGSYPIYTHIWSHHWHINGHFFTSSRSRSQKKTQPTEISILDLHREPHLVATQATIETWKLAWAIRSWKHMTSSSHGVYMTMIKSNELPSLKLTARPWKWGPPGKGDFLLETTIVRGELSVSGRVGCLKLYVPSKNKDISNKNESYQTIVSFMKQVLRYCILYVCWILNTIFSMYHFHHIPLHHLCKHPSFAFPPNTWQM